MNARDVFETRRAVRALMRTRPTRGARVLAGQSREAA